MNTTEERDRLRELETERDDALMEVRMLMVDAEDDSDSQRRHRDLVMICYSGRTLEESKSMKAALESALQMLTVEIEIHGLDEAREARLEETLGSNTNEGQIK